MSFADGDIPVSRSVLPEGEAGVDATVEKMSQMAKGIYGARSAKIRALSINVINRAKVADKDYFGMVKAIHNWVRDEIRYVRDPIGQETLSFPEEMAFNTKAGDCDDKTILEMAMLGSLGIPSYPVVVGMQPGRYSHVYLHAIIPPGRHRYAGATIAADPIMREWPLGKEAPASKVKAKKLYSELAGLGMTLGSYARGPAYIDERDVASVKVALKSKLTDTGSRGRIMNTAEVVRPSDDLDSMFVRGVEINMPFTEATRRDLYSLGPVTARGEQRMTSYLSRTKSVKIPEREVGGRAGPNIVTVRNAKHRPAVAPASAPTVRELQGLSDYLSALEPVARNAGQRQTIHGATDVLFKLAAAASIANERARSAAKQVGRVRYSMEMFGLGAEVDQNDVALTASIASLANAVADKAAAIAKLSTGSSPARKLMLAAVVKKLENAQRLLGSTSLVGRMVPTGPYPAKNAGARVEVLTEMAHDPELNRLTEHVIAPIVDEVESPIDFPLPAGSFVRDSRGVALFADGAGGGANVEAMEMAGFGSKLKKKLKKAVKVVQKISPSAHLVKVTKKAIAKVATKSPIFKPLVKKSKVFRKVFDIKNPSSGGTATQTQYLDADGKPISAAEYAAQSAAAGATDVYEDENGNRITKEQYEALIAKYEAEYQAAVAAQNAAQAANQNVIRPPVYAAPQASFNQPISPQYGGSQMMPSGGGYPVDSFGPSDLGPTQSTDSFSTEVEVSAYGQPGEDASEGTMPTDESVQYDEDGNPIPMEQPAAEAPSGGGFMPFALIGGAALYFFNK